MEQLELLRLTAESLDRLGIRYALVGSFASGAWGEPRMTHDIDVVADLNAKAAGLLAEVFAAPEFYLSQPAAQKAIACRGQFNVLHPASGNKIDFMMAGETEWAESELTRARRLPLLPDLNVSVASPEDVILGKLLYYREGASDKHLRDIASILSTAVEAIEYDYLNRYAKQLGVEKEWQAVLSRINKPDGS